LVRIQVTAFNGRPLSQPLVGEFNELGGTIGRADGNTLVLPDPERHISRTHAVIAVRAGGYVIRDQGSAMPVEINGQPLGNGHEAPIAQGDELRIGGYAMRVEIITEAPSTHFSGQNLAGAAKEDSVPPAAGGGAYLDDPFADFAEAEPEPVRPVPISSAGKGGAAGSSGAASGAGMIPEDFDPFADLEPEAPAAERLPEDFDLDQGISPAQRIDDVFGLDKPAEHDPLASPLQEPARSTDNDPLAALEGPHRTPAEYQPVQRDDAPELQSPFRPPRFRPDDVPSFGEFPRGEVPVVPRPSLEPTSVQTAPAAEPVLRRQGPATEDKRAAASSGAADLLRAFLNGTGVPGLELPDGLTPELMQLLGQLLREATQGTLDLLLARALVKRELRAAATMIVAQENNPLKFSPNVEVALMRLLRPQEHGFMGPQRAMRDAYDDLRSHQFAFMAGMRAALEGVLQKFDPEQLERRLAQASVLDSLLPMNRKARLWHLFAERYGEISREAEDDFHSLFGREFLRAYEEQIEKLRSQSPNTPG
jgi:FHA domain-containing protein